MKDKKPLCPHSISPHALLLSTSINFDRVNTPPIKKIYAGTMVILFSGGAGNPSGPFVNSGA